MLEAILPDTSVPFEIPNGDDSGDPAIFYLRPLTGRQLAQIQRMPGELGNMDRAIEVVTQGLVGFGNGFSGVWGEDQAANVDQIPIPALLKLADEIMKRSGITEEDRGNLPSPSATG